LIDFQFFQEDKYNTNHLLTKTLSGHQVKKNEASHLSSCEMQ